MIILYKSGNFHLILRNGKMNGFNFNEHKNDKVGILRSFVKKFKSAGEEPKKKIFDSKQCKQSNYQSINQSYADDHLYNGHNNVGYNSLANISNSNVLDKNK